MACLVEALESGLLQCDGLGGLGTHSPASWCVRLQSDLLFQ